MAINEGTQQYPYPCQVNAASFVSVRLSGKRNYKSWKKQMMCLLESHDMLGFIDGTIEKPQEEINNAKYREWKRSDALVKGWIFGSLSENVMETVVNRATSYGVWNKLKNNYTSQSESSTDTSEEDVGKYVDLCRAIEMGDWDKAQISFNRWEHALTDKLNTFGERALHIAIGNPDNILFLEKLLARIDAKLLPGLVDNDEENALHCAARLDNTKAAMKLVEKNPDLLFTVDDGIFSPIHQTVFNSQQKTFLYLYQECKKHIILSEKDGLHNPFKGQNGVSLLNLTIVSGFFDVAYELLKDNPELATTLEEEDDDDDDDDDKDDDSDDDDNDDKSPLYYIAEMSSAYPSAKRYNFFQRFVYSHVPVVNYNLDNTHNRQDIENQETYTFTTWMKKSYIYHVIQKIYDKIWNFAILHVQHIKHLHEDKRKHYAAIKILMFICEEVGKLKSDHEDHYYDAFIVAVKNDTPEVIQMITRTFPESIWTSDDDDYSLPQLSTIYRSENVYNFLVHGVTQEKYLHKTRRDKDDNNILHMAGRLAPIHKLNMVTGAALQMQREIQWFQEVKKFMRPKEREARNINNETPTMVFTREHEDLRKKGEEWIKKTADSCTITAALIITIVFAAAITVPGGNKGDTGKPYFETKSSFIIFAISDAISLFTSTTSLLLFLSILTARYAVDDFLYRLPNRLIIGLVMLFISVTTMMIAFSATLYIMFGQEKLWILLPVGALTCLPIASFVTLQLPLLYDLISSTYGRGIFYKRRELYVKYSQSYIPNASVFAS